MPIAIFQEKIKYNFHKTYRCLKSRAHHLSGGQQTSRFSKLKTGKTGDRCMTILIQWNMICLQGNCISEWNSVFSRYTSFIGEALPPSMFWLLAHIPAFQSMPYKLRCQTYSQHHCRKPQQWKEWSSLRTAHGGFTSEARKSWSALRSVICPHSKSASVPNCKMMEDLSGYAHLIYLHLESKYSLQGMNKDYLNNLYLTHDNDRCYIL